MEKEVTNVENAKKGLIGNPLLKTMSGLALERYLSQNKKKIFCNKVFLFLCLIVFVVLRQSCATQVLAPVAETSLI